MKETMPYYDYAVPYQNNRLEMKKMCDELYQLGFRTIAVEEICNADNLERKIDNGRGKKSDDVTFPAPVDLQWLKEQFKDKLLILQRLTIIYRDCKNISKSMANCLNLIKYDVLAARPMSDDALAHACTTFEGDLISYNLEEEGPKLYRKLYALAQQRNVLFEVRYAPVICNDKCRRNSIKFTHILGNRNSTKPKMIISSGATDPFHLRSPEDIMFMVNIFGLSESEGKKTIHQTGQELFLQCASRRIGKTPMNSTFTGTWQITNPLDSCGLGKGESNESQEEEKEKEKTEDSSDELIKAFFLGPTKRKKNRTKKRKKTLLSDNQQFTVDQDSKRPKLQVS